MSRGGGAAPATSSRRWLALTLLCAVQFMVVLDVSIVNIALPSIEEDLRFSEKNLQWVVSGYALTFGGFLLLAGRAADLFGRRRFFMIGLGLFTASSLACGLAVSDAMLVVARAAQGLGAAMVSPAALSLLTTTFREGDERNHALGVWGAVAAGGAAAGLLLGGLLTAGLGWEWVFFVNAPVGALAIALAPVLLSESRDLIEVPRLDLLGAVTVTGGLVLLVYGLTQAEGAGFGSFRTIGVLALAAALVVTFRFVEGRVDRPLVPFRVFRSRTLTGANLVALVSAAVIGAQGFFSTLYMQQILDYSPLTTGLAFLPLTLTIMATSALGSRLVSRVGTKPMMVAGMSSLAIGMFLLGRIPVEGSYVADLLPGFFMFALGLGLTFVTAIIAATAGVADSEQGLASGLINTSQQVGTALGLAILVTVAAVRTEALEGNVGPAATALVGGYRYGFAAGAALAVVGVLVALFFVRERECAEEVLRPGPEPARVPCPPAPTLAVKYRDRRPQSSQSAKE
jgi:EmrB/QacA subfamily drug resistance transporter